MLGLFILIFIFVCVYFGGVCVSCFLLLFLLDFKAMERGWVKRWRCLGGIGEEKEHDQIYETVLIKSVMK